jgi:hypothetical protein
MVDWGNVPSWVSAGIALVALCSAIAAATLRIDSSNTIREAGPTSLGLAKAAVQDQKHARFPLAWCSRACELEVEGHARPPGR